MLYVVLALTSRSWKLTGSRWLQAAMRPIKFPFGLSGLHGWLAGSRFGFDGCIAPAERLDSTFSFSPLMPPKHFARAPHTCAGCCAFGRYSMLERRASAWLVCAARCALLASCHQNVPKRVAWLATCARSFVCSPIGVETARSSLSFSGGRP
eukprot:5758750-Prymnesium_polylepis.1